MRRKGLVLAFVVLCLGLPVGTGSSAAADTLQVALVWEKTFSNTITDFAIAEKPDGTSYLPVVTIEGTESAVVHFFDEDMSATVQIPLDAMSLTHITKDGQYVGTFESEVLVLEEETTKGRLTVYDGVGNELWTADSIWEPMYFFILGEGDRLACMYEEWGSIVFYNSQGDTIAHWVPWRFSVDEVGSPEDTIYGHAAALYSDASENRQFVVVNGCPDIPKSRKATVFLFNKDGTQLWQRFLGERGTDDICLSHNGGLTAAEAYTVDSLPWSYKVYILSEAGDIVRTHEFRIPRSGWSPIALSDDGKTFAYAPSAHTILCYNTESGRLLWQYDDSDTVASFTSLAIGTGASPCVLAAASTDSPDPNPNYHLPRYVYLFTGSGQLLWKKQFSGEAYVGFAGPIVRFAKHDLKQFFVAETKTIGYYICQP